MTATTDPTANIEDQLGILDYVRKPFFVRGVQVTEDNIELVAQWCNSNKVQDGARPYISVYVPRAMNERQKRAYVGDWVLSSGSGYKVFTKNAFDASFERTPAPDAGVEGELVQKSRDNVELTEEGAKRITDLETGEVTLVPGTTEWPSRSEVYEDQHGEPEPADKGKPVDWSNAVLHKGDTPVPTPPQRVYKTTLEE